MNTSAYRVSDYAAPVAFVGNSLIAPLNQTEQLGIDPDFWNGFPAFGDEAVAAAVESCAAVARAAEHAKDAGGDPVQDICVKGQVLPAQLELYRSCDGDLDRVYGEAMNGNGYFGRVIEPGHVYELGYERCTCPKVLSGQVADPDQCNCSRQSILYIFGRLEPGSDFDMEIVETVLRGAEHCRFRITKQNGAEAPRLTGGSL